ncbi:hypothetical protein EDD11_005760 [Mortierella claussenii]|nr:hypothetical protein EDD11_005760 [Mortierella claussenii]
MASYPGAPWPSQGHPHSDPHHHHHHSNSTASNSSSSSGAADPSYPQHNHHLQHQPQPASQPYPYHPSYYHPGHHPGPSSPGAHPHHSPYYSYPAYGSSPYPAPYPPHHGHGHTPLAAHGYGSEHGRPPHSHYNDASVESNASETTDATLAPKTLKKTTSSADAAASTKSTKAKPGPKPKAAKDATAASSSSETAKSSTSKTPKTLKTFRFEGSISSESFKTTKSFDLAGVNILNRKPLDTKTALDKLQRRRETHNRVERKRRDCINQLIDDLTQLLPAKHLEEATSKCHRVNVLRGAVSHIKFLNESNQTLTCSIRAIKGDDAALPIVEQAQAAKKPANEDKVRREMSMDVDSDDEEDVKIEDMEEESVTNGQQDDSSSRSASPTQSSVTTPKTLTKASTLSPSSRKMVPPPVIITDAPSPSSDRDPSRKGGENGDSFSLNSRPRSNSFASSVSEQPSPRSASANSPLFPPSPISPLPIGRQGLFPSSEGSEGDRDQRQLSPFMSHSPKTSPSLPPISSLANLQLQSPSGHLSAPGSGNSSMPNVGSGPGSSFSGRTHRAGTTLPPLMIPEQPHHLHPSYHQGGSSASSGGSRNGNSSNRNSLTLSPHSTDQPPISPFMLSPMLSRSPSMGPVTASSPGNSPYPNWGHDGASSPHGFSFTSPHTYPYGYQSPHHQQAPASPPQPKARPQSLQPESIFIQEEPWHTQRKRSTSSVSGKIGSLGAKDKRRFDDNAMDTTSHPTSPTSSVTSTTSYPASPNPKKRAQLASYDEAEDEDTVKRSKQVEQGVVVTVEGPDAELGSESQKDEDAAQALTSLAQNVA